MSRDFPGVRNGMVLTDTGRLVNSIFVASYEEA